MRVRALGAARDDARAAGRRLEREERGFGRRFAGEFSRATAAIRANPRLYAPTEDGPDGYETREFFIARFNYRVIYLIWNNEAVVVAVVHAARPPGTWVPRLDEVINPPEDA